MKTLNEIFEMLKSFASANDIKYINITLYEDGSGYLSSGSDEINGADFNNESEMLAIINPKTETQ